MLSRVLCSRGATLTIAVVLCAALCSARNAEVELRVTGRGESEWSARNDAIRLALQQAMAQLVIADRIVSEDKVLRDTVMSTMNGFVDQFEPINTYKDGGEIVVDARVVVSNTRIENFLGGSAGASASIRGSDLSAALQGELAARTARAQVLWRLFAGYPGKAIEIKIDKVGLSELDPRLIVVDYTFSTDKTFLSSLKQGLKVLGRAPAPSRPNKDSATGADKERTGSWLGRLNKTISQQAATPGRADFPDTGVCIETPSPDPRYAGINDCYPLPAGDYRSQFPAVKKWHMTYHYMLLLVDFVDQRGNSLLRHGPALGLGSGAVLLRLIPKAYSTDPDLRIELPAFKGQRGRFQVPVEEMTDIGRVSKVAIVPVATDWQPANERPPHSPIDWSHNALFSTLCQNAVLFDMPACTPFYGAIQELRLRATR